jgi:hypothetical protein
MPKADRARKTPVNISAALSKAQGDESDPESEHEHRKRKKRDGLTTVKVIIPYV